MAATTVMICAGVLCAHRSLQAAHAGTDAKAALLRGETNLAASKLDDAQKARRLCNQRRAV